ncbi:MAG: hypothetical protein RLZZ148_1057 [Cyanobacteriota bacterium]
MLSKFRSRYPQGSLISELLQIDHGKYIVRVSIILEGKTLTGLAAMDTVEAAEDQARLRALALLEDEAQTTESPTVVVPVAKSQAKTKTEKPQESPLTLVSPTPEPLQLVEPEPEPLQLVEPEPEPLQLVEPEPEPLQLVEPEPELKPEPPEIAPSSLEPGMDFNQVMAQIDVEMKRLKWTKEEGRDYLRSTYGKTSRIQLNDEEIIGFLGYLKTQ